MPDRAGSAIPVGHGGARLATRCQRFVETMGPAAVGAMVLATFILYVTVSAPFDSDWYARDVEAYWSAAERIRAGANPYARVVELPYQYAPWFAYAWVPLTLLPREIVQAAWSAVLLVSVAWLARPLISSYTGIVLAMLVIPQVMEYAWIGNVDALMLAAMTAINTRAGPVAVGLAASLKISPIAFALVYLVRGERRRAGIAVGTAALLWAPVVLFDISGPRGTVEAVTPYSLWSLGPAIGAASTLALLGGSILTMWRLRRRADVAAAVAAIFANPFTNLYNVGYLLIPVGSRARNGGRQDSG